LLDHHQEQRVAEEEVAPPRRAEQEVEHAVQVAETEAIDGPTVVKPKKLVEGQKVSRSAITTNHVSYGEGRL